MYKLQVWLHMRGYHFDVHVIPLQCRHKQVYRNTAFKLTLETVASQDFWKISIGVRLKVGFFPVELWVSSSPNLAVPTWSKFTSIFLGKDNSRNINRDQYSTVGLQMALPCCSIVNSYYRKMTIIWKNCPRRQPATSVLLGNK